MYMYVSNMSERDRQTLFAGHAPDSLLRIMLTASIHNVKNPVSSVIRMTLYRNPQGTHTGLHA